MGFKLGQDKVRHIVTADLNSKICIRARRDFHDPAKLAASQIVLDGDASRGSHFCIVELKLMQLFDQPLGSLADGLDRHDGKGRELNADVAMLGYVCKDSAENDAENGAETLQERKHMW